MQLRAARAAIAIPFAGVCAVSGASLAVSASQLAGRVAANWGAGSRVAGPPQVTGVKLASALLPATAFPSGFTVTAHSDSGRHLETAPARYHLGVMTCVRFATSSGQSGFGETATASDVRGRLFGGFSTGSSESFRQMVYQFASARAARSYFQGLQTIAGKCGAWRLQGPGGSSPSAGAASASADGASLQVSASLSTQAGTAQLQALVVLNGADVFEVDAAALNRDVPATPALDSLAHQLITRVHAAH